MDILRRELNEVYARQRLDEERLDHEVVAECRHLVRAAALLEDDCRVITDAASDECFIFGDKLGGLLGIAGEDGSVDIHADSGDEDIIYGRMHPEDLVEKRMLEYEFFKSVDALSPECKRNLKACCSIRIRNKDGNYIVVDNTTRILRLSPAGRIWLILCTYALSSSRNPFQGISPRILDNATGEVKEVELGGRRERVLTPREKEIIVLAREGLPSKIIADRLGISVHTVNRHRQNILEKLSVGNTFEAVRAAEEMGLL